MLSPSQIRSPGQSASDQHSPGSPGTHTPGVAGRMQIAPSGQGMAPSQTSPSSQSAFVQQPSGGGGSGWQVPG